MYDELCGAGAPSEDAVENANGYLGVPRHMPPRSWGIISSIVHHMEVSRPLARLIYQSCRLNWSVYFILNLGSKTLRSSLNSGPRVGDSIHRHISYLHWRRNSKESCYDWP